MRWGGGCVSSGTSRHVDRVYAITTAITTADTTAATTAGVLATARWACRGREKATTANGPQLGAPFLACPRFRTQPGPTRTTLFSPVDSMQTQHCDILAGDGRRGTTRTDAQPATRARACGDARIDATTSLGKLELIQKFIFFVSQFIKAAASFALPSRIKGCIKSPTAPHVHLRRTRRLNHHRF